MKGLCFLNNNCILLELTSECKIKCQAKSKRYITVLYMCVSFSKLNITNLIVFGCSSQKDVYHVAFHIDRCSFCTFICLQLCGKTQEDPCKLVFAVVR